MDLMTKHIYTKKMQKSSGPRPARSYVRGRLVLEVVDLCTYIVLCTYLSQLGHHLLCSEEKIISVTCCRTLNISASAFISNLRAGFIVQADSKSTSKLKQSVL
ncbi:hypothetical protein Drorol1_Dr00008862 [Drosera rotundifolia]